MAEEFKLQEWLSKAKGDPKLAAQPIIIILAIVVLGWKFLYAPQKAIYEKEKKKNKAIENEIKGLESAVENIEELKIEVETLKQDWLKTEALCYKKAEVPQFLQDLRKLAQQAGLTLKSINPQPPIPKIFANLTYEEYPVKISFVGDISQLGIFLRLLEKHDKIISVALPPLIPDASGTFKFDLIPTTVLLPDRQITQPVKKG